MEDLIPYFIMGLFILIVQAGSLWLSATEYISNMPTFENPESIGYSVYYIVIILIFTALIIYLIKTKTTFIIRGIIYISITMTLYYVFTALLAKAFGLTDFTPIFSIGAALIISLLLYKYPEWYVIDFAGLMISIGACTVIGVSLSYVPIIVLMIGLLIYDFISVYKTKHMLTLANGMMDMKLPILFVIPKKWNYSYINDISDDENNIENTETPLKEQENGNVQAAESPIAESSAAGIKKRKSDALFMGLGDAVIPTLLVISSNRFIEHSGWISMPALYTMIGTFAGFAVLMYVVSRGNPQAGLPFLNTGAILGFAAGVLISGAAVSFSLGF